ncbi:MAG TPA: hypothetical protein VMW38_20050, partial [Terriglobia bacterium]|nr:hypothetical protein [Terriglobia bacterium]
MQSLRVTRLASLIICSFAFCGILCADGIIISLNGTWQIEDSQSADNLPQDFNHLVQVPGLVHNSRPSFPNV